MSFDVHQVVGEKMEKGVKKYLIEWVGYDDATWEPAENLNCVGKLQEWDERKKSNNSSSFVSSGTHPSSKGSRKPVRSASKVVKPISTRSTVTRPRRKASFDPKELPNRSSKLVIPLESFNTRFVNPIRQFHPSTPFQEEWLEMLSQSKYNIHVSNTVDEAPPPPVFEWSDDGRIHSDVPYIDLDFLVGCTCVTECRDLDSCTCFGVHLEHFPYDKYGCVQYSPSDMAIYECNLKCSCTLSCLNRVTQRGPQLIFEIFRSGNGKGWGVRTLSKLRKGQFISMYTGEIITVAEAGKRENCNYMFDIDYFGTFCLNVGADTAKYVIDASRIGNISRMYNHSCEPNAAAYTVFLDTHDSSRHEVAFFTIKTLEVGEEITFDYGGGVGGTKGKSIHLRKRQVMDGLDCVCGAPSCRGLVPLFSSR